MACGGTVPHVEIVGADAPGISATRTTWPGSRAAKRSLINRDPRRDRLRRHRRRRNRNCRSLFWAARRLRYRRTRHPGKARPAASRPRRKRPGDLLPIRYARRRTLIRRDAGQCAERQNRNAMAANSASPSSRQAGNGTRRPGQLQNVQPGIGAVDDVDVAAFVGLDIVGLDRDFATLPCRRW